MSTFIVANLRVDPDASGPDRLGRRRNENGNNELRVVEAKRSGRGFSIEALPDKNTKAEAKA